MKGLSRSDVEPCISPFFFWRGLPSKLWGITSERVLGVRDHMPLLGEGFSPVRRCGCILLLLGCRWYLLAGLDCIRRQIRRISYEMLCTADRGCLSGRCCML